MAWMLSKSTDDSTLERIVELVEGKAAIQRDLKKLEEWIDKSHSSSTEANGKACFEDGITHAAAQSGD